MPDENPNKEISIVEEVSQEDQIFSMFSGNMSAERARALSILLGGNVPSGAIRKHPGFGGKTFYYIDHIWITNALRTAFGAFWSFEASEATIEADGTATAKGTLKVKVPNPEGEPLEMVFTEYGACNIKDGMTLANKKLSAVSRALARCAMRAFGIGQEFYTSVDFSDWTNKEAWNSLELYVKKNKKYITLKDIQNFCHENKIEAKDIKDRYEDIWFFAYETVRNNKIEEQYG